MRIPTPPLIVLSQNGQLAASVYGAELTLVDVAVGTSRTQQLPHEGVSLAFSPLGRRLVVTGDGQVSLFEVQPGFKHLATRPVPAPLFRMALAEDGLLVGTAKFSEVKTTLCVWQGEGLEPGFSGEGYLLGSVAAFQLGLDAARRQVLLSGATGRGAYSGQAKRFAGLVALGENRIDVTWKGEGLPFEPDGYLFPLAESRLGIYRRNELQVLTLDPAATPPLEEVSRFALENLETVVASPNGAYIGWRWGDGPGAKCQLRVADLATGQVRETGELEGVDYFPALAVSDAGQLTLAFSQQPNRLLFYRLANGQLRKQAEVETEHYSQSLSWSDQD